jgi:hypothetical protein
MAEVTQRLVQRTGGTNVDQEYGLAAPLRRTSDAGAADATRSRPQATSQLSPPWRKLLLTVHIIVSVGLLGADAAVLLLCIAGARGAVPGTVYPAAHLIGVALLVPLALLALATGLAQGLLTSWGIVRYWWVTIKLTLTVAGIVLALLVLMPTLGAAADAATAVAGAPELSVDRLGLVRDTAAASTVLIVTVLLAVYKPFGRLRGRQGPSSR